MIGNSGFHVSFFVCFGFVFLLAKIIVPMGLDFNWFFSLFMFISNNFLSLFLPSLPVACLEFWGFCSVTSGHTHTELLGLLLQVFLVSDWCNFVFICLQLNVCVWWAALPHYKEMIGFLFLCMCEC